jgi:hypothetical protein
VDQVNPRRPSSLEAVLRTPLRPDRWAQCYTHGLGANFLAFCTRFSRKKNIFL